MIIQATSSIPGRVDLSALERLYEKNPIERVPFRASIGVGERIEVDDKYYTLSSIQSALSKGWIEVSGYNVGDQASTTAYIEKTANYTAASSDHTINCTENTFTITLPTAVGITGRMYVIKNSGTGNITVDGDGTETIDDQLTQKLNQYDSLKIQSTNVGWIII